MIVLSLRGVGATYGEVRVLSPLHLEINAGEKVALVGGSGAGKSTLLKLLHERSAGRAVWIPQELGLVQQLSAFHNVYMGRLDRHASWYNLLNLLYPLKRERESVRPFLDQLGLADKARNRVGELSGGQKQRTAVARALFQGGDLVLADEPVSALDGPLAHRVMQALSGAFETLVVALHDVDLALRYTDRVIGIRGGVIALDQPTARLGHQDLADLY